MERRNFLKQAAFTAAVASASRLRASDPKTPARPIARRPLGKTGEHLSIIGFGGIVVMNEEANAADSIVSEAVDRGINYFDVAPSYGNAQERLGLALKPYRDKSFLACKTDGRLKDDSRTDLENSLRLLQTDHLDLYQFHALTKMTDLDKVLGPGGAIETFEAAKKEGKIRYIGFSVHSVETALAALDRYDFDTVLFPLNWVLVSQANFGLQILKRAQEKQMGILCSEEHGQDRLAGGPAAAIILSPSAGTSRRAFPMRLRWACAGRWAIPSPPRFRPATSATSASPWTWRRITSRWSRTKSRPC